LDIEISDFKAKHVHQVKSLHDIIHYMENENHSYITSLKEATERNAELINTILEYKNISDDNQKLKVELDDYKNNYSYYLDEHNKIKLELNKYKQNYLVWFIMYVYKLIRYILCFN
jgi:hypothetical protein